MFRFCVTLRARIHCFVLFSAYVFSNIFVVVASVYVAVFCPSLSLVSAPHTAKTGAISILYTLHYYRFALSVEVFCLNFRIGTWSAQLGNYVGFCVCVCVLV